MGDILLVLVLVLVLLISGLRREAELIAYNN